MPKLFAHRAGQLGAGAFLCFRQRPQLAGQLALLVPHGVNKRAHGVAFLRFFLRPYAVILWCAPAAQKKRQADTDGDADKRAQNG